MRRVALFCWPHEGFVGIISTQLWPSKGGTELVFAPAAAAKCRFPRFGLILAGFSGSTMHYPHRVSRIKRKRSIGFRARMKTRHGRALMNRKRAAGRSLNVADKKRGY